MIKNNELTHHGIAGQKWGKKNGPPYPLSSGQRSFKEKRLARKEAKKESKSSSKSSSTVKSMTDDELSDAIKRLKMEKEYKSLISEESGKKNVSKGKQIASEIMESAVKDIGKQAASYGLGTAVNATSKALGGPDNIVNPQKAQKAK